jgi:hypothetical protein
MISCVFQNQSDNSGKTCCITYQACDQKGPQSFRECNGDIRHELEIELDLVTPDRLYCYTVTASNDAHTVNVKGSFISGNYSQLAHTLIATPLLLLYEPLGFQLHFSRF